MAKYVCDVCGYEYDEQAEGTPFAALPDDWTCPVCGVGKDQFSQQSTYKKTGFVRDMRARISRFSGRACLGRVKTCSKALTNSSPQIIIFLSGIEFGGMTNESY